MQPLGSLRSRPARRGRLSFARTCIRYLRERILYSVNTNTRRQDKLIARLLAWLGNAVGVFNECKSSRADSEYRFSSLAKQRKVSAPLARSAWLRLRKCQQPIFRLPLICTPRQPENQKTTRPKQRVVFHLQQSPSLFRFHFHAATLGVVARSGGGVFRFAQLNVFAINALFFQKRLHRLGAFFG